MQGLVSMDFQRISWREIVFTRGGNVLIWLIHCDIGEKRVWSIQRMVLAGALDS